MDARDLFRDQLRTILGPALREQGFAGSGSNWRKRNPQGDWACINIQKSAWGSANSVSAYINLSINPLPAHLFGAWSVGRVPPKQPSTAGGLWRSRLQPPVSDSGRRIQTWNFEDGASGVAVVIAMSDALRSEGVPVLNRLLERRVLLDLLADATATQVEGGHLMVWSRTAMRALLLSDDGPDEELEAVLHQLDAEARNQPDESFSMRLQAASVWARQHAAESRAGLGERS